MSTGAARRPAPRSSTRARQGRVDRRGRAAEPAVDELAQLVDDRPVAVCAQHVHERLRGDDLADRRRERRRADLAPDPLELVENLLQPVAGGRARSWSSIAATSPIGTLRRAARTEIRGASGVTGRSPMCSSTRSAAPPRGGRCRRRGRGRARSACAATRPRPGASRARPGRRRRRSGLRPPAWPRAPARARCRPRPGRRARRAGRTPRAARRRARAARCGWSSPAGSCSRIRAAPSSGRRLRSLDERLVAAAAVQQACIELAACVDDRLGRVAEVVDVVQRVVQPEDVDAALGGAGHEPAREVAADRA